MMTDINKELDIKTGQLQAVETEKTQLRQKLRQADVDKVTKNNAFSSEIEVRFTSINVAL